MTRSSTRHWEQFLQPVDRLLACAALREALGSLLLYDAIPEVLEQVAETWRWKLAAVLGQPLRSVRQVRLGPWTTEEDLWGLGGALHEPWLRPGLFADEALRLVVIHDLPRLSLAGLRACVSLMGAEIAAIERDGQSRSFRPRWFWLASCALQDVGQVSPHLLDRFALRLCAPTLEVNRLEALLRSLGEKREQRRTTSTNREVRKPSGLEAKQLADAFRVSTRLTAEACAEAVARFPHVKGAGHRGLLTLTRVACALAQLEHVERYGGITLPRVDVRAAQVREAARLLQLPKHDKEAAQNLAEIQLPSPDAEQLGAAERPEVVATYDALTAPMSAPPLAQPVEPEDGVPSGMVMEPAVISSAEPQPGVEHSPLEVERAAPIQRDHAPLHLPFFRFGGTSVTGRGVILGARPATDLRDISLLHTLLEAAPYQPQRRKHVVGGAARKGLLLARSDLRSYRRAPVPQHLLVLVLDYTSMDKSDWQSALRRYLAEAYVERAQVCIIQVGIQGEELRARRIVARNLLVPSVAKAFDDAPGRSTPLADGLTLAAATLRRMLHVGRGAAHHAWLVVFTDGRGNIPLEASRTGQLPRRVGREGVDDALQVAAQVHGMRQVTSVLLKPPLSVLSELPVRLADALGADLVDVAPLGREPQGGPL